MSFVPYLKQSNPQKTEKSFESYLNLPSPPLSPSTLQYPSVVSSSMDRRWIRLKIKKTLHG